MVVFRLISYGIYTSHSTCEIRHSLEKNDVLEFSIRLLSNPSEWIPLSITHINDNTTSNCRRGYCVQDTDTLISNIGYNHKDYKPYSRRNIQICGFPLNDSIQLRWLMSSTISTQNRPYEDKWSLDDIQVKLTTPNHSKLLMAEIFDESSLK